MQRMNGFDFFKCAAFDADLTHTMKSFFYEVYCDALADFFLFDGLRPKAL